MLRGNDGREIFFDNMDRCHMCLLIQHGVERYGHRIHAYCFMNNHVHFAIQVSHTCLSVIMQNVAFRYTQYINKKYNRVGHLFQGRFKSILIDSGKYLKELVRYIHLNPVRASLVDKPEKHPWSSHNTYLGIVPITWVTSNYLLTMFSDNKNEAIDCYQNYVQIQTGCTAQIDFKQGEDGILGDDTFIEFVRKESDNKTCLIPTLPELTDCICNFYNINASTLSENNRNASHIRALLALLVRESENLTLEELGQYLQKSANSLSRQAARLMNKSNHSESIQIEISNLKKLILQLSECPA